MSKKRIFLIVSLIVLIFTLIFVIIDSLIVDIVVNSAKRSARIKASEMINEEVYKYLDDNNITYNDLVSIVYDSGNNIKSVESKTIEINKIRAGLNSRIIKRIKAFDKGHFNVRIGSFLGHNVFSGIGPDIKFKYDLIGSVNSRFKEEFVDAGINQVKHRITLETQCDLYVIMPLKSIPTKTETEIILSETVIVGDVPKTYISF